MTAKSRMLFDLQFLEAIIELLNTNGDLFKRIYETDSSISLSVIQQKFYQFYNLNFTRKARKGIVSELRKFMVL